ncbi:MAG TPA: hypothetical protein PKI19_02105 [Elusimicrobiales bacterium]|nr:hypothetical protein [Elusimicrobiales bacterium]
MMEYTRLEFDYPETDKNKIITRGTKQIVLEKEPEQAISFEDKYYKKTIPSAKVIGTINVEEQNR